MKEGFCFAFIIEMIGFGCWASSGKKFANLLGRKVLFTSRDFFTDAMKNLHFLFW